MKGNIMIRMISLMIIVPMLIAHFVGQINLLEMSWLWLTMFAGLNALQATFTGWCPVSRFMPKDPDTGACCAADTSGSCCTPKDSQDKQSKSSCCDTDDKEPCCSEKPSAACCSSSDVISIKVLGTGCKNCETTTQLIQTTADEMGVNIKLEKVEDIADIAGYGVMSTPGVVLNDKVVFSGSVPSKQQVKEMLEL